MNIKRWINRRTLSSLLYYTGFLHILAFVSRYRKSRRPVILMAHRVIALDGCQPVDNIDRVSLAGGHAISPGELERRLRFACRVRTPGNPKQLAGDGWDRSAFYLTFDDGYRDNIDNAGPVLDRLGIEAVIFVLPTLVSNPDWIPWWDFYADVPDTMENLGEYAARCQKIKHASRGLLRDDDAIREVGTAGIKRYLDMYNLQEIDESSPFYVSSHTMSHPNLTRLDDDEIDEEISNAADSLRELPRYLPLLAYPFGFYDSHVLERVRASQSVNIAFATGAGSHDDNYCLRRLNLNTRPYSLFMAEFLGVFDCFPGRRAG
jgi:peptidoglycan/xylan/chitin deacetylase (PgdA/CDA1 family)